MSGAPADPAARIRAALGDAAFVEPLPGDASDRLYYRVRRRGEPDRIVMVLAGPIDPPGLPFDRLASFFHEGGFPVPRVVERHPAAGLMVLEDLGDISLQAHLESHDDPDHVRGLYAEAVDLILRLQRRGTPALVPDLPAYHFALDELRLGREMDHFVEHYVRRLLGDPLAGTASGERLAAALREVAARAGASGDRVLCHRDFHSRNLMLPPGREAGTGRLVMIDFQDARLGPRCYDLASLLCDAYVEVPTGLAAAMRERFRLGIGAEDRAAFETDYATVALQRALKAVGTFAGQSTRLGVDRYLRYIPRAIRRAREAAASLPGLEEVADLLDGPLLPPQS